jgi:hypothetical protein
MSSFPADSASHFHIRWNDVTLDWECFNTRKEAVERALFLQLDGETFAIEEVHSLCPLRARNASQSS